MKYWTIILLILALVLPPSISKAQSAIDSSVQSTVRIESFDIMTGKLAGQASGVFVTENGWILTNKHVVEDFSSMFRKVKIYPTKNEKADEECSFIVEGDNIVASSVDDIALIIPPEPWRLKCKPFSFITPASGIPPTGTPITAIGFPVTDIGSDSTAATSGKTAGVVVTNPPVDREELKNYMERTLFIKMDIQIGPGNSGGPVIDENGLLVGISTAMTQIKHSDGNIQNFVGLAVPSSSIIGEFPEIPSEKFAERAGLSDVSAHAWYAPSVQSFLDAGYLRSADGKFRPSDKALRWEFISLIVDLLGGVSSDAASNQDFTDISPRKQYFGYFSQAVKLGLVKGAGNCLGSLPCYANPEAPVNRAEAAALLLRAFNLKRNENYPTFIDAPSGEWFTESIESAASLCILRGDDGSNTVRPADNMNRAEMIVMLERLHRGMFYPQCAPAEAEANIAPAPGFKQEAKPSQAGNPCTQGAWECAIKSTCGREMEQMQNCVLKDKSCSNPDRAKPPSIKRCFPAEKKVREMIDIINYSEKMLEEMGKIILELPSHIALRGIEIRQRYSAKLSEYKNHFDGALKYSNYIMLKTSEIEVAEQSLVSIENEFFSSTGAEKPEI